MAEFAALSAPGITLGEAEADRIVMLRLRKPVPEAMERIGGLLGVALPQTPNQAAQGACRAIWMGPNEWMLIEPGLSSEDLEAVPGSLAVLAVEVGDGRYALDVEGVNARDFLAKAVSIDLHPSMFPQGRTAMTLFAQVPVVIDHVATGRFRLWFDVSLRAYVRAWCAEALVEFAAA